MVVLWFPTDQFEAIALGTTSVEEVRDIPYGEGKAATAIAAAYGQPAKQSDKVLKGSVGTSRTHVARSAGWALDVHYMAS
jgi:hypothetical protein